MLVSLNWLKKYTDIPEDLSMEQLAHDLTMRTVEVEGYYNPADNYRGVIIAKILSIAPHPDADRLRICQVDAGNGQETQIVCGGTNLYEGELVVLAAVGAMVRWHGEGEPVEIKKAKLRGVESEGMICASDELDLGNLFPAEEDGIIMDLTNFPGAKEGLALSEVLQLDDMIIEIDNKSLTNRPDLWGHYGIARELAAIYKQELRDLPVFDKADALDNYQINIEDGEDCPRYTASIWQGLENKESPYELKKLLHLIGHSSHGLIVDISNYVMYATGQPNHTYDLDKVGESIEIRRAKEGEELLLLEDINVKLSPDILVIAKGKEAIGLAGVKGGKDDSILPETKDIVLEVANFNPSIVRRASKGFRVHTEAAARFEKGLDLARIEEGLGLFQALVKEYLPEAKLITYSDQVKQEQEPVEVLCSKAVINSRLGRELSDEELKALLTPLAFSVDLSADEFKVKVPSWRATGDISMSMDIVEELARMIGYENFDYSAPQITLDSYVYENSYDFNRRIREYLAYQAGLREIYLYPWTKEEYQKLCGYPTENAVEILDPPSPEEAYLNESLVPGLLAAAEKNNRFYEEFALFSSAQVFSKQKDEDQACFRCADSKYLPHEETSVAGVFFDEDAWRIFREAKGVVENISKSLACEPFTFAQVTKPEWADPEVYLNILNTEGEVVGNLALVSAYCKNELGLKRGNIVIFEFPQSALKKAVLDRHSYQDIPHFPLVEMDFSLIVPEDCAWAEVEKFISGKVSSLEYIGEYRSEQMPEGKKSLTFRIQFGKEDGTLSGEEIEQKRNSILKTLNKTVGAELRQ